MKSLLVLFFIFLRISSLIGKRSDEYSESEYENDDSKVQDEPQYSADYLEIANDAKESSDDVKESSDGTQEDASEPEDSENAEQDDSEDTEQDDSEADDSKHDTPRSERKPLSNSWKVVSKRFIDLVNSPTFVDKTDFIQEIFENKRTLQMNVITSPKGFGKTSLMDMIKFFAQLEVDNMGAPKETHREMLSYSIFTNKSLDLSISKNLGTIEMCNGRNPVMYLNFKNIIGNSNIRATWRYMHSTIRKLFAEYRWLTSKLKEKFTSRRYDCTVNEKLQYSVMQKIMNNKKVSPETLEMSLFILSEALFMHFKRRVLVIIDDFDVPFMKLADHPKEKYPKEKVLQVLGNMLDRLLVGINKLRYVDRAILTGTTHLRASTNLQSYTSSFKFNRFLDSHPYAKHFGFTRNEVKSLFKRNNIDGRYFTILDKFYNGYAIQTTTKDVTTFYCPQSVISHLTTVQSGSRPIPTPLVSTPPLEKFVSFLQYDKIRSQISRLLVNKTTIFVIVRKMEYEDIEHMFNVLHNKTEMDITAAQAFFTFLIDQGFITNVKQGTPKKPWWSYGLANYQSILAFANCFRQYALEYDGVDLDEVMVPFEDIFANDEVTEEVLTGFKKLLRNLYSTRYEDQNEYRFHTLLYSALVTHFQGTLIQVKINSEADLKTETNVRTAIAIIDMKRTVTMIIEVREEIKAIDALKYAEKNFGSFNIKMKSKLIQYLGLSFNKGKIVRMAYKDNKRNTPLIIKKL